MRTAALAEQIHTLLRAVNVDNWSKEVTINVFQLAIDPIETMKGGGEGVFIVPIVKDYDLSQSNKRTNVISTKAIRRVAITLAFPFATKDTQGIDVSTWEEAKKLYDFREEIEETIINGMSNIEAVDPEPAMETTFDKRYFMAMTEFYFHAVQC